MAQSDAMKLGQKYFAADVAVLWHNLRTHPARERFTIERTAAMRNRWGFVYLAFCLMTIRAAAQEPVYSLDPLLEAQVDAIEAEMIGDVDAVTLDVDAALWEDDEVMESALAALPDGEVPRNVRKFVAGVVAEMQIVLSKRISGDMLLLDNGTKVDAKSGRKKKAKKKKTHGVSIVFDGDGKGQPESILVRSGHCVRQLQFPKGDASGAPQIISKCAIKK
jgi:hypothetical protein